MTLFWILWACGILVVALAMELIKLGKGTKKQWNIIGACLVIIMTTSIWLGLPDHVGNPWILPALYIAGYVLQLIVDMYGAKKVMMLIINAWLKKHGYEKVEA